ncbi:hypothetical protein Poli38472_013190 [Pythium oligandrum]|uniref:AN1-type domain-containing protein n=1 Tax=Pythium oligandrum TaxID=41045 RepID=A0A8K1C2J4_PYTOL|nr:hypothetical protein Poli38472_013190 [Pythium oligandrum]|eukprot:TMW55299.1 hypothetical protein Poli38472_013190 [Pythium oligandrum]
MDIGAHCYMAECRQQDFLPFKCDCCERVFCLDHRSYDAHTCPCAGSRDRRVVECPLCKQMIRWTTEQDVNGVWEEHVHSGKCVPDSKATKTSVGPNGEIQTQPKKKKPRCGAERCREVLLTSNQFHCQKCGLDVCLKHRYETDHDCDGVRQRQRQQRASVFGFGARSSTTSAPAARKAPTAASIQQNARAAASNVVSGTKSAVNTLVQKGKAVAASTVTTSSEECPICQQKFSYVSQLIAHVNRTHPEIDTRSTGSARPPQAATSSSTAGGREVCPQCRAVFTDVTALISHVESTHSSTAVAAGGANRSGNADEKCLMM